MAIEGIDHWVIVAGDLQRTLDLYFRDPDDNLVELTVYDRRA